MNQGYGMGIPQQHINPNLINNNMYMNNPQMPMNMNYPQQQFNNYPNNAYPNPNMAYNMQQPGFNQNPPQQNMGNNQRGSVLDFF